MTTDINTRINRRVALAALMGAAMLVPATISAKPARHGLIQSEQPDGTTLTIRLMGDEHAHRTFSEDGFLLTTDAEGFATYATIADGQIVSTGRRAVNISNRSQADLALLSTLDRDALTTLAENIDMQHREARQQSRAKVQARRSAPQRVTSQGISLLFDEKYPVTGSPKALIVLVQYSDKSFDIADPHDYFSRMVNEPGFSDYGGNASVLEYFTAQSHGTFTPQFDVYGPVTLPNSRSYYGANDYYGNDKYPEMMAVHALNILDSEVDFSQYDTDGDGYIDNVYVFYAGYGEADGGGANTVWPHSWNVPNPPTYDGVKLSRYACSNETDYTYKRPDGIGTFCHEFSHVMGLPDLYATNYSSSFTPGEWSCLDYGPYNNQGRTPPNYSIFEKYALGWMEPRRFGGVDTFDINLRPITDDDGFRVECLEASNRNEFILIEARNKVGFDQYIPNSGMLVWRIDYNEQAWTNNTINNTASRQRVDIIEADNRKDDNSRAGDCFPGSANVTSFTTSTLPAFATRLGRPMNVELLDITRNPDGSIGTSAVVNLPDNPPTPSASDAVTAIVNDGSINATVNNGVLTVDAIAPVSIINMAGMRVAEIGPNGSIALPAGLYILHSQGATIKVVVK